MSSTAGAVQGTSADDDNIQQEQEQGQADEAPPSNENENNASNHNNASINKKIPPLSEEARALVKEEKEAIFFRPPPRKHFKNLTTLWGSVEHLDWDRVARYRENIFDKSKLKKNQYPGLIQCYETAMLWLSKPSTNAFAERVFSMASWFASNRRMNRQGSKVFEMRTLDCINRKVLESIWVAEQELVEQEIVEGKTVLTVSDEHGRESVNNQDVLLLSEQSRQGDVRRYHQMINGLPDHMDYNDKASESLVVEDDDGPQKFSYIGDDGKTYEADSIDIVDITRDDVPEPSKGEVEGNGEGEGEVPTENQAPATQALTSTVTDQHQMNESDDESDGDLGDAYLLEYLKEQKDEVEHEGDMTVVSLSTVQTKGQDTARSSAGGKTSLDSSSKKRAASKTSSVSSDKGGTAKKQKRSVAGKKPSPEERLRAKKKDGNKDGKKRATVTSLPLRRNTRTPSPNRQGSKGKKAVRRSPRNKKRKQQSKSRAQKAIVYEVEDTEEEDNEEEEEEEEGSYSDDDDEDGNDDTED